MWRNPSCLTRRPTLVGLAFAATVIAAATPAMAQMRGDFRINTAPRMMSPGGFGMRVDPSFRTPSTGGEAVNVDPGNGTGGGKPPTRTIVKKQDNNPPDPPARRARSNVPPAGEQRYLPDEVVIEIAGSPAEATLQALSTRFRLTRLESQRLELTNSTFFRWRIPDARAVPQVVRALEADAAVRLAQPNYVYRFGQAPAGSDVASRPPSADNGGAGDAAQYALAKLRLSEAHGLATGDKVLVAVIDSGIDTSHPELAGVVAESFDALGTAGPPHQHGTGVAGIIAAHARLKGAAPNVKILAVRAFGAGEGSTFSIIKGLDWAAAHGARIINMSFTGPSDPLMAKALTAARAKGAILIAAAGNAGPKSKPLYPAADAGVIAVTAIDENDKLFAMANRGAYVAVAAPGVDILMPSPNNNYWVSTGTSMAAAYVSGVAALILERQPQLDGAAMQKLLASTARDLGPKGRDDQFGAGLIDAYQAITALESRAAATAPATAKR